MSPSPQELTSRIKKTLEERAFVRSSDAQIVARGGTPRQRGWLFDIRAILLRADTLEDICRIFWNEHDEKNAAQIGGIETAAIPLITALVYSGHTEFKKSVSGFFIRKSRKKDGLMKMIEGEFKKNVPVILVDDLINSGKSLMRQVKVIEEMGGTVQKIWTLIRFRNTEFYRYFNDKGIPIESLFTLSDFSDSLGLKDLVKRDVAPLPEPHTVLWKFASENPSYHYVVAKSDPAIDAKRLYVGSDDGTMWALNQSDGTVVWSFKIGHHQKGKGIFSSPLLFDGAVYFGGYDGNVYALNAETGIKKWIYFDADWIGSSPTVAPDLGLIFVGLEFGLFRKRGGIAALDSKTGKKKWAYTDMPCFTHSSPLYIERSNQVVIGSNDGCVYLFDAQQGTLVWKFVDGTPSLQELNSGFSTRDIKESFAYDEKNDRIIFGNKAGKIYAIDRNTGKEGASFSADFGFYSTPVIHKDSVIVTSLDKYTYCLDIDSLTERWRWYAGARIFATPVIIENNIYIGANTGRLTELDPDTGKEKGFFQFSERITNKVAYNPDSKLFFVPTFANEIYCVRR